MKVQEYDYSSSDDEAPEAISIAQSRTETLGKIKEQAKARQAAKERRKTIDTNRKVQIEIQKAKVQAALAQLQTGKESLQKTEVPTPANLKTFETKLIKFEDESGEEADEILPQGQRLVVLEKRNIMTKTLAASRKQMLKTKQALEKTSLTKRVPATQMCLLKSGSITSLNQKCNVRKEVAPKPIKLHQLRGFRFSKVNI